MFGERSYKKEGFLARRPTSGANTLYPTKVAMHIAVRHRDIGEAQPRMHPGTTKHALKNGLASPHHWVVLLTSRCQGTSVPVSQTQLPSELSKGYIYLAVTMRMQCRNFSPQHWHQLYAQYKVCKL
jgi:hypothetical protein